MRHRHARSSSRPTKPTIYGPGLAAVLHDYRAGSIAIDAARAKLAAMKVAGKPAEILLETFRPRAQQSEAS